MNFDLEAIIVEKLVGNAIFGQSGGPTAVINQQQVLLLQLCSKKVSLRKYMVQPTVS